MPFCRCVPWAVCGVQRRGVPSVQHVMRALPRGVVHVGCRWKVRTVEASPRVHSLPFDTLCSPRAQCTLREIRWTCTPFCVCALHSLRCLPCPTGALCLGGADIVAEAGWWQGSDAVFYRCQDKACCPDGGCAKGAPQACTADRDPTSRLCSQCSQGLKLWCVCWRPVFLLFMPCWIRACDSRPI